MKIFIFGDQPQTSNFYTEDLFFLGDQHLDGGQVLHRLVDATNSPRTPQAAHLCFPASAQGLDL